MERIDFENIAKLLADEHLVAFLMEENAERERFADHDWDRMVDISYFGHRGFSEMKSEELQKLVVDSLVGYFEDFDEVNGEAVSELIVANTRAGRALVEVVLKQKEARRSTSDF